MTLHELHTDVLAVEAHRRDYPKWWSLCLLRGLGLPTLDAVLIEPTTPSGEVAGMIDAFAAKIGVSAVLVRSDFSGEAVRYRRGGISYPVEQALDPVLSFLRTGRAVILLEPTNRFSNLISINITIDRTGECQAEGLGCGFDTSDLQRSLVTPQWIWSGTVYEKSARFDVIRSSSHSDRVGQRLRSLSELFGISVDDVAEKLMTSGNECLFREDAAPPRRELMRVIRDAAHISSTLSDNDFPFTLAFARLWNGRDIYWDITPGKQKWASKGRLAEQERLAHLDARGHG